MISKKNCVSVIVPLFNRERYIKHCINSILDQDYDGELEVIVVDDGSSDHSVDLVKSYGNKVRLLEKPSGLMEQGAAAARNRGLAVARGEFLAFLDSDDYYLPGYIRRMAKELNNDPESDYAFCRCKKEETNSINSVSLADWTRPKLSALDKKYHVLSRAFCINTNVIFLRRKIIEQVGNFDTNLTNGEDSDLWMRVSEVARGQFVDIYGAVYRTNHGDSQLTGIDLESKKNLSNIVFTKAFSRNYGRCCVDKLRLLLITRALLYGVSPPPRSRIGAVILHGRIILQLLVLFPVTTIRFLHVSIV